MKVFGADDNDALSMLRQFMEITFVTGDKKGYAISKKRISQDMKFDLHLVSTFDRLNWIKSHFKLNEVIYMGDGIFDSIVMKSVGYAICPNNSDDQCKKHANYITKRSGGERAVAEAVIHIFRKFYKVKNPIELLKKKSIIGEWAV